MSAFITPRLLVIVEGDETDDRLAAMIAGGVDGVLLRDRHRPLRSLLASAERLCRVATEAGALFLVHDRVDLVLAGLGGGVHLPEAGMPTRVTRELLGEERGVGRSCHDLAGAHRAFQEGADYVTLSPLFPTESHPGAPVIGCQRFGEWCRELSGPVLALGGVDATNAGTAIRAGGWGVALIRGILAAPLPGQAAREIRQVLDGVKP